MFLTLALCFLQWVESVLAERREARAPGGLSALHVAAAVGHPEVVQLLSRGLAVHGHDDCGWTPLLYAAACADAGRRRHTVRALLEAGADAGYEAPSGDSALSLAALARRLDVVTDLAGPMLLYKPQSGWTYLHWAIHSRNVQSSRAGPLATSGRPMSIMVKSVEQPSQLSDTSTAAPRSESRRRRRSPLDAIAPDAPPTSLWAKYRLHRANRHKSPVDTTFTETYHRDHSDDCPPSRVRDRSSVSSSSNDSPDRLVIRALIAAGHKVSIKDKQGSTALHLAAEEFYVEGARILLEAGAKIEKKDQSDHTALVLAAQRGQGEMVKCLMGHKPDLKKTNFISWTALHYAARNGPPEVVKYLIDQGADVNVRDLNGWKPIHVAARYSDDEVVAALLSGGADRTETLPHVASPLRLAVVAAQPRSVRRLLAAGAEPADDCLLALATSDDCNDVDDAARPEVARILLAAGARADPATAQEARKRGFALLAATIEAAAR
ncbi:ankyrin-1-like [Schistocerca serialis cubense]|uniref:ankyrin-1-like n=1 Tax=Schistocerca serialis cubense TaxID=2023355 RepID=UPI00214ED697|nr:ankyrin-1-like [Schistocerca serialis cubense]